MTRVDDAREGVGCPKCKVRKGARCKRLTGSVTPWKMDYVTVEWVRTVYQPGEPMENAVHPERLRALDKLWRQQALARMTAERRKAYELSAELAASANALRAFDRAEVAQMRDWLKLHWRVLLAPTEAARTAP